jgi:hypothetical protein
LDIEKTTDTLASATALSVKRFFADPENQEAFERWKKRKMIPATDFTRTMKGERNDKNTRRL